MKKFILLLTVIMLSVFVSGCNLEDTKPNVSFIYEESSAETFVEDDLNESDLSSVSLTTSNEEDYIYYEEDREDRDNYYSSTNYEQNYSETYSNTENNSNAVYKTPTGKRYHYSATCGGKNSTETTLEQAIESGLTPCKKCVH